jgi:phosphate starvation-inducible PhoH-like protein
VATETLHFENARFAQQLFNHEPRNLQALETELGVKATAREGWIKLDGAAEALERAKQLFASLENLLKAGSPVKNREFTHALNVVKHEGGDDVERTWSATACTTHERKPGVTAKTVGQKKYIDAIRKHDITFGIGPAGTGKTYLAVATALSALREGKSFADHFDAPGGRGRRGAGIFAGRSLRKNHAVSASAARRAARHAAGRGNREAHGARHD